MSDFLHKIWNFDFENIKIPNLTWFWIIFGIGTAYLGMNEELLFSLNHLFDQYAALHPEFKNIKYITIAIAVLMSIFIVGLLILHDRKASKEIGRQKLYGIFVPHFLANIIDVLLLTVVVFTVSFAGKMFFSTDLNILDLRSLDVIFLPFQQIVDFYNQHIPTVIKLPYLLAFIVTILLADLPVYIFHYACHWSRFLWFVMHRSHHSAEYLHVGGQGPVFGFLFLMLVPLFFVKLAISKLMYTEPMYVELIVFQIVLFITEKYNHSSAFYKFANSNRVLSFIFRFFGNGPYHITHHSAKEGEDIVNIANVGFNFWDRLFGTYKEPDKDHPPVGLTNQPKIKMNPFRLYLGGLMTILYELKHNSPKYWFKILFASVYYTPPKTKEYLIESYPNKEIRHIADNYIKN